MNYGKRDHSVVSLFTFLLLLIFAAFSLSLAVLGSTVYKNGVAHMNENYTSRTAIAYVTEKIRQNDRAGAISFSEVEGCPALALSDSAEDASFTTYIYYYDGSLRELYLRNEYTPAAVMGTAIVDLAGFSFETVCESDNEGSLLKISVKSDGAELETCIPIHCKKGTL